MILNFNIENLDIAFNSNAEIVSDSSNFIKLKFTIIGTLANLNNAVYSAVIYDANNQATRVLLDDNNECYVTRLPAFRFRVGLYAMYTNNDGLVAEIYTKTVIVKLSQSAYSEHFGGALTPSEFAQLNVRLEACEDDVEDLKERGTVTVDTEIADTTNPVQNQAIYSALQQKSNINHTHSQYLTEHQDISGKANTSDVLTKTNTSSYTPTADYHPATKKYVDDGLSEKANSNHTHSQYLTEHQDISGKEDKPTISTQLPANNTLIVNTEYYLGEQQTLSISFEDLTANDKGKYIYLCFESGSTATNLTVDTSNTTDFDFAPSANSICEIMGKWNGELWLLVSNEMTVTANE